MHTHLASATSPRRTRDSGHDTGRAPGSADGFAVFDRAAADLPVEGAAKRVGCAESCGYPLQGDVPVVRSFFLERKRLEDVRVAK